MIYLDNSATTQPTEAVRAAVLRAMEEGWYNPSALYRPAMEAERACADARKTVLESAGAAGHRLVFTGSGTEADNLAILGYLRTVRRPGRVLILQVEHPAVGACIPGFKSRAQLENGAKAADYIFSNHPRATD